VVLAWPIGGALWPKSGSWNPTMTMVALSQHLADMLTENTAVQASKDQEMASYADSNGATVQDGSFITQELSDKILSSR
jgi:hypothetical protein